MLHLFVRSFGQCFKRGVTFNKNKKRVVSTSELQDDLDRENLFIDLLDMLLVNGAVLDARRIGIQP